MANEPWLTLLRRTSEDVQYITSLYDADFHKTGKEKLEDIDQWMRGESHLFEANDHLRKLPQQYLQNLYFLAKCSTEATKQKIDKLSTVNSLMPELFSNRSVEEFKELSKSLAYFPLPQPCPSDRARITIAKVLGDNLDHFSLMSFYRYAFMISEYRLAYDFTIHERIVLDISRISPLAILPHLNPIMIKKADMITGMLGIKIKGIHIITSSNYVDKFVAILKQAMRPKVASRLHVHSTYEDFHRHVPKEIIPSDFGGDEISSEAIAAQWKKAIQTDHFKKVLEIFSRMGSDESKRSNYAFNEEYMGMPGSFRKLSVD